jgi:hypoxanthine phosphoribosyltransferase
MEDLVLKLREYAVKINSFKKQNINYSEFVPELCSFLKDFNKLMEADIDEALSILWYFVHEKTFEDKNLSKHKILSAIEDIGCKNQFVEFYHFLGKVYEAVERLEDN